MSESVEQTSREQIGTSSLAYAPATGERRAAVGYSAQYLVAAELILDELLRGRLQWIRVADPAMGSVDDIVIGTDGRVDAYQVKWSQHPRSFTFGDLIGPTQGKTSLLAQLASGWNTCKRHQPSRRTVVHLLTNRYPSTGAVSPTESRPDHFAAFISQVWEPVSAAPLSNPFEVPEKWSRTWGEFTDASGLSEEQFRLFVNDCEFEFGRVTQRQRGLSDQASDRFRHEDIDELAHELWQIAAEPRQLVHLSRDDLIRRMSWDDRFNLNSPHRFPVNRQLYQHIAATSDELSEAIEELPGGYVVLLGSPGSGKSSLLTETLNEMAARVVRYYAYVPDDAGPATLRGESVNFLHDVATELDRLGFRVGSSTRRRDRVQLLSHFHQQMQLLNRDWGDSGTKTVILIDGLDHIEREQQPERSLLKDLPRPDEVPEGVYFILGTQTDGCLPNHLRSMLVISPRRRVEMRQLSRRQVIDMMRASDIEVDLTDEQCDRAFNLSGGHPLYANYLINQFGGCADSGQINVLLDNSVSFEGEIEAVYETHWNRFDEDFELKRLFGLLARIRRVIDMRFVSQWAEPSALHRLTVRFSHFFKTDEQDRLYFFHNSFKLFLTERTSHIMPGRSDAEVEREFHSELADHCADAEEGSFWSWEELHHRIEAGQYAKVSALAKQFHFRKQMLDLRPQDAVWKDLIRSLRLATEAGDVVALVRLLLAGYELNQRQDFLDYIPGQDLVSLVVALGEPDLATEYLRDGDRLRVDETTAFHVSTRLAALDFYEEGARIFRLAEPIEMLNGNKSASSAQMLMEWARAAAVFATVEEIIGRIDQIRYLEDTRISDAETATQRARFRMLQTAGLAFARMQRWDDVERIADVFESENREEVAALFWFRFRLYEHCVSRRDEVRAKQYAEAMTEIDVARLGHEEATALAEVVFRAVGDAERAEDLVLNVGDPQFPSATHHHVEDLRDYAHRIRFNRLAFALGDRRSASDFVPDAKNENDIGLATLERSVCEVAQIWGRAWSGEVTDIDTLRLLVLPLIRRFAASGENIAEIGRWYYLNQTRMDFYSVLIDAVADHGRDAVAALAGIFEQEWNDDERMWPYSDRRGVVQELRRRGAEREWIRLQLEALNDAQLNEFGVAERVEENFKQAVAWFEFGDHAQAEEFLKRAVRTGFGVAYSKDYQLDLWIELLGRINETDPTNASHRISRFVASVENIRDTIEWQPFRSACESLILVTSAVSPVAAVRLMRWLLEEGMTGYQGAIRSLLRGALRSDGASSQLVKAVFLEMIVPFDPEGDPHLTNDLIRSIYARESAEGAAREVGALVSVIRRHGMPSARHSWLRGVVEGLESVDSEDTRLGIRNDELGVHDDDISESDRFKIDGSDEILYKDEVTKRAESICELRRMIASESEDSYFDWVPVVKRLVERMPNLDDVEEIEGLFAHRRDAGEVRTVLSERLLESGSFERAWETGVEALDGSSRWEWYDRVGGARFNALRILVCIDRSRAVPLFYDTLVSDLDEAQDLVAYIVRELPAIVDLLEAQDQMLAIWQEIETYTGSLLPFGDATTGPELFADLPEDDTWDAALMTLAGSFVDHDCLRLAQSAIRTLGKATLEGEDGVAAILERSLIESEGAQERVLMLLHALSIKNPDALGWARGHIIDQVDCENWSIRERARAVAENCGWDLQVSTKPVVPLPAIYFLSLPDDRRSEELINPLKPDVELLASIGHLDPASVARRVVETMERLAPYDAVWSEKAERALAKSLTAKGLWLPYVKPRFRILRRALNHVATEIVEAGRISAERVELLRKMLRDYDPDLVLIEPQDRPSEIAAFPDLEFGVDRHDWISNARDSLPLTGLDRVDGRFLLAESTRIRLVGDRSKLSETRWSSICPFPLEMNGTELTFTTLFGSVKKGLAGELPSSNLTGALAIRNLDYGYDSPGSDWIALNPSIAFELGWSRDGDGLFRWLDEDGRVMVESFWWTDGTVEFDHPGYGPHQVGSGWLVVASEQAYRQIAERYSRPSRGAIVVRESHLQNDFVENAASTVRPIGGSDDGDFVSDR